MSRRTNIQEIAQVRQMIAEEVDAKANIEQAKALKQQTFWIKWMTVLNGTSQLHISFLTSYFLIF